MSAEKPTQILRTWNPRTGETIDVYLPLAIQTLGRISKALGDEWMVNNLPIDAPRPDSLPPAPETRTEAGA